MSEQNQKSEPSQAAPLIGRERIRGATRVIAEGTDAATVTAEQIAAVAADVLLFVHARKVSRKAVARAIHYSEAALSGFLTGNYKGASAQIAIDLDSWLVEAEKRESLPQATCFAWTNVALLIKGAAHWAMDHRTIALVYSGESTGLGKTTSLQAIHQLLGPRRSALATINKVDATPSGLLRKICSALHIEWTGGTDKLFRRIVEHLKGRSHILLLDQIHNLCGANGDKPLFYLADVYDATGCAQLWAGTTDIVAYLARQRVKSSDESLVQIRRRIFPCIDLLASLQSSPDGGGEPLVTLDQVREMFARSKMRITSDATRFLCALINTPDSGSIGSAVQLVSYAASLAEMAGKTTIDMPLILRAMKMGWTENRATAMVQKIEEESARLVKVG